MTPLHKLENKHWQAGILPETGASIAYGRIRYSGAWVDILRPTDPADYDNSSKTSSFIMLPWANRIREGLLRFDGATYQLKTSPDDGTARHGDVRKRPWQIATADDAHIRLTFDSGAVNAPDQAVNWPFAFRAAVEYRLEDADFVWALSLTSADERPFPAGFGFHPYFVRTETMPLLHIPCEKQFPLENALAVGPPQPVAPRADFRQMRPVPAGATLDDLLTDRTPDAPVRLSYPDWRTDITLHADPLYRHVLVFTAPDGTVAVEPQTNANDGFNLREGGIAESGVFVVAPGETVTAAVRLGCERA